MDIHHHIEKLLAYAYSKQLLEDGDVEFARNQILDVLGLIEGKPNEVGVSEDETVADLLAPILDWAAAKGFIELDTPLFRDLFDTKLMGCLTPWPSVINSHFYKQYQEHGPAAATKMFYQMAQDTHYIRMNRVALNESWTSLKPYGELEITINLSKPELDPKDIAKAKQLEASVYPDGLLHRENVGYAGRVNHPARQNLRQVPLELTGEKWLLQFSPYVYYHQHAIVLSSEKRPMNINQGTFSRLLEFVEKFPHYFIGSNADLPIVGGSILSHDHYQAGQYEFPMERAETAWAFKLKSYPEVTGGVLNWPMSVIRLQSSYRGHLEQAAASILENWRQYEDRSVDIYAHSGEAPHNTITPIARRRGDKYELDLVLRNNRTTEEHPLGLFHPHAEVHPVKKENIGLIEVMGLAILPGRLKNELTKIAEAVAEGKSIASDPELEKHADWVQKMISNHSGLSVDEALQLLKIEVGHIFSEALCHCGVFKQDEQGAEAFSRFIDQLNKE